jgi:hypothetical protein
VTRRDAAEGPDSRIDFGSGFALMPKLSLAGLVLAGFSLAISVVQVGLAVHLIHEQSAGRLTSGWLLVKCALTVSCFVLVLLGASFSLVSGFRSKVPAWVIVVTALFAVMGIATSCLCGCGPLVFLIGSSAVITR